MLLLGSPILIMKTPSWRLFETLREIFKAHIIVILAYDSFSSNKFAYGYNELVRDPSKNMPPVQSQVSMFIGKRLSTEMSIECLLVDNIHHGLVLPPSINIALRLLPGIPDNSIDPMVDSL